MIKTLALDTPNIKITDNDTPIRLTPYDDGVKLVAGTWIPTVYVASSTSAFTKSIPAIWDGDKVVIQSSTLADLPVDKYDVEVWLNDGSEQLIYPDYGYVKLNINQTVAGINANLISSVTVAEFRDMFASLATDLNDKVTTLDADAIHKTGNESADGIKTFTSTIVGSITGNAGTSTKLTTPRSIQTNLASTVATNFDGTANVTHGVTGVLATGNGGTGRADGLAKPLTTSIVNNTDLNTIITPGLYSGGALTGVTNKPTAESGTWFVLSVESSGTNNIKQTYTDTNSGFTSTRTGAGQTIIWSSWKRVPDELTIIHNNIGTVIMNSSSSSSGESVGTWSNIGSATIGSTTVYYWKRTA